MRRSSFASAVGNQLLKHVVPNAVLGGCMRLAGITGVAGKGNRRRGVRMIVVIGAELRSCFLKLRLIAGHANLLQSTSNSSLSSEDSVRSDGVDRLREVLTGVSSEVS